MASTAYPPGHEPDFWDPIPARTEFRFAIGRMGSPSGSLRPLVAIGMNPSHANEAVSDTTINRLIEASIDLGYSGWVMLNLYPERASSPASLKPFDQALSDLNCVAIKRFLTRFQFSEVFGAWGDPPNATIRRAKVDVVATLALMGTQVFHFGDATVARNPRHLTPRGPKLDLKQQQVVWTF